MVVFDRFASHMSGPEQRHNPISIAFFKPVPIRTLRLANLAPNMRKYKEK